VDWWFRVGSKKSMSSSNGVHRHHGADSSVTASTLHPDDPVKDSEDCHTCLRVAVIVTPVLGLCVLVPIIVVAVRLLSGSQRRQTRRSLVLVPAPRPSTEEKSDSCLVCDDPSSLSVYPVAGSSSRSKFVVLTAAATQPRRSPGGGYQQIIQPSQTAVCPCRCCERATNTTFHAAVTDGDFV